jgi:ribosomal protein L37E
MALQKQSMAITFANGNKMTFKPADLIQAGQDFVSGGTGTLQYLDNSGDDKALHLHDRPFMTACHRCGREFDSSSSGLDKVSAHLRLAEYCKVDGECFDSWDEHNKKNVHNYCNFCPRKRFKDDTAYMAHFAEHHAGL